LEALVSTQVVSQLERSDRRSRTAVAVSLLGPLTVLAGVVWALVQPYRLTFLDPAGHGFWSLAVEPPLLVLLVGVLFHLLVAPGIAEDLAAAEGENRA
jgi:hypothetical protein